MPFQQFTNIYDAQEVAKAQNLDLYVTIEKHRFMPEFQHVGSRTYAIGVDSKYFDMNAGGNGLFGWCLANCIELIHTPNDFDTLERLEHLSFEHVWVLPKDVMWSEDDTTYFFGIDTPANTKKLYKESNQLILYLRDKKFTMEHVTYNDECPALLYISMLEAVLGINNNRGIKFTGEGLIELQNTFNHVYTLDEMNDMLRKITGDN